MKEQTNPGEKSTYLKGDPRPKLQPCSYDIFILILFRKSIVLIRFLKNLKVIKFSIQGKYKTFHHRCSLGSSIKYTHAKFSEKLIFLTP